MTRLATLGVSAAVALVVAGGVLGSAQEPQTGTHVMKTPDAMTWGPPPPSLPPGALVSVLSGDPTKEGPFTMRAKMPDGYRIPPHWHPVDEHVTVVEGTFYMGLGETFGEAAGHALTAGGFAMMSAGTRHFAWAKGDTIVQIHGMGPWRINYVNPDDDPRRKPTSQ